MAVAHPLDAMQRDAHANKPNNDKRQTTTTNDGNPRPKVLFTLFTPMPYNIHYTLYISYIILYARVTPQFWNWNCLLFVILCHNWATISYNSQADLPPSNRHTQFTGAPLEAECGPYTAPYLE